MTLAIAVVALVATVLTVTELARRLDVSAPLLLTIAGVGASFLPFVPPLVVSPELVLVGLLPPLLYAASVKTSLVDLGANRRNIGMLSVGLVAFTAIGVGLALWWLFDVPLPLGIAVGGVVAPPDAVAAAAGSGCRGGSSPSLRASRSSTTRRRWSSCDSGSWHSAAR